MNKKPIARLLALLAAAGALAGCETAPQDAPAATAEWRQGMAIQLWTFHRDLERDLSGTLKRIKALGFDRVETYPVKDTSAQQLRAALDAAGLVAVSAHLPWDQIKSDLAGVIADARALGVDQFGPSSINMFDGKPYRVMTLAEADEAGAYLRRACAAARQANMRVFVHTHGNELAPIGGTTPLDRMLHSAGHCFEIEADIAWVKWAGVDPAAFFRRHGSKVSSLHVKDIADAAIGRDFAGLSPASFPTLGQGSVEWVAVMRAARVAGVRHYIIEDDSADPARQIPQSLEHLDTLDF